VKANRRTGPVMSDTSENRWTNGPVMSDSSGGVALVCGMKRGIPDDATMHGEGSTRADVHHLRLEAGTVGD